LTKAIKFVPGNCRLDATGSDAEQELRALDNIKSLRHPFLLSIERVEIVRGDLILVTELADRSLHDLLTDYRQAGKPGIPREEALTYLREVAEVLDVLHYEHGLQHLDIKPRNLFLVGRHVKVGDFGLVASLADLFTRGDLLTGITPLYAAPEIFERRATLFSDQYSLAVTYHELMTGDPPFKARNAAQLAYLVSTTQPDLSRLPESDRAIVARGLSKDPRQRFPSCTEFIDALFATAPIAQLGKSRTTSFEFSLGEMEGTAVVPTVRRSGVLRRDTRVVSAIAATESTQGEQLAGFQLLDCLSRGPAGELWRARGPQAALHLIRFLVPPDQQGPAAGALDQLLSLRHATLPRTELHPLAANRVALVCEAGETSLANRLRDCRAAGQLGVPRAELLAYLSSIAYALDELYHRHQMQHLCLTPRHLAVNRGEATLLEFGLAELLWIPQGLPPASFAPRYAALELHDGLISDACDQFSLALMFQELLVGIHPYRNLNARQMASPRLRGQPDLSLLPATDRPIVMQALDPEPDKRFRSCAEFIMALEEVTPQAEVGTVVVPVNDRATRPVTPTSALTQAVETPVPVDDGSAWREAIDELVRASEHGHQILSSGQVHYRLQPGVSIEQRLMARLAPGMARLKLASFREHWQADLLTSSASRWRMEIKTKSNLLQRCLGRIPALQVEVVLGTPRDASSLTPVRVTIEPIDCARARAAQVLGDIGPTILASLQGYFNGQSDRTAQERFPLQQVIQVNAPAANLSLSGSLRDIGRYGLTLRAAERLPVGPVKVILNRWASPLTVQVPGWVRECSEDGGQFEIDIDFAG
jgi:serine/threonine protein kinase